MSESIGEAYIRIIARGDDVKSGIEKSFKDAEPSVREGAREHGKTYSEEFDKEVRKSYKGQFKKTQGEMFKDLNESMTASLARLELSDRFFKSPGWKKFRDRLGDEGGRAGELLGQRLEKQFRDSGNLEQLSKAMSNLGPGLRKAQADILKQLAADQAAALREQIQQRSAEQSLAIRMNKQFDAKVAADLRNRLKLEKEMQRQHADFLRVQAKQVERDQAIIGIENKRRLQEGQRLLAALDREYADLLVSVERLASGERGLSLTRRQALRDVDSLRARLAATNKLTAEHDRALSNQTKRLQEMHPRLVTVNRSIDNFADGTSRAFGKGSRNNFVNFVGGLAGAMARIPRLFTGVAGGVTSYVSGITNAVGTSGKLSAAFKPLAKNAYVLAAALVGVFVVVGPLVATLSLLAGIVTALGSSLIMGAIGALGALAGAGVAAGAGIAVLVAGIRNMPKAAKESFRVVGKEFGVLGDIAGKNIFSNAARQAETFSGVLRRLRPVTAGIGQAIAGVGDYFSRMVKGPGFNTFLRSMNDFLPRAVGSLGRSMVNAFGGFGGVLRGLVPITDRFLRWLEQATSKFSKWANSAKGQNSIKNFMEQAGDSVSSLGKLLGNVSKLLGTVMTGGGSKAGNSLIDSMAKAVGRWNDALKADPGMLQRWFDKAVEFGQAIGDVAVAAGKLFDALDSAGTRTAVIQTFQGIALAAQAISIPFANISILAGGAAKALGGLALAAGKTLGLLSKAPGMGWLKPLAGDLTRAGRGMLGFGNDTEAAGRKTAQAAREANQLFAAVDKIGFKRRSLEIAVKTLGMKPTFGQFEELARRFKLTPKQIKMIAKLNGFELTKGRYAALVRAAKGLDRAKSNPRATLRDNVTKKGKDIGRLLNDVGRKHAKPQTTLRDAAAKRSLSVLEKNIRQLGGRHAKPQATLNPAAAKRSISSIDKSLAGLSRKVARPSVSVSTGAAFAAIRAVNGALSSVRSKSITIHTNYTRSGNGAARATAIGGTFHFAQTRLIGEAGPEAVVPLNRPLNQVDPSVRWLSAIAQGKSPANVSNTTVKGRNVEIGNLTLHSQATDAKAAASEFLNQLAAKYN